MSVLEFFRDVLKQPALLMGIMSFVGLIALKKPGHKIMTGTLKPILGYLMLGAGADFITSNLDPLGKMIQEGFHINGVVPNNEAIVSVAQKVLGVETMTILIVGLLINLLIARFTKFKYVFLTGHHSFFMACLLSAVLGTTGMSGTELILFGGFLLGAWSSISPAIGQRFTRKVTDGDDIALGHFGSLAYYISAWVGSKVGKPEESTEKIEIPEKWGFLRDTTISTALTMMIFYLIAAIAAGPTFVATISDGTSPILFALMAGLKFAVGVTIVYSGVIGMILLGFAGGVLIIPGLVPHFFCGATAGIFGNATGGRKGAIVGSFVNGLLITFAPALLLPVLGSLGFQNTTFGDFDFGVLGIILGKASELVGKFGIIAIVVILLVVLIVPNFIKTKSKAINNLD